MAHNTLTYLFDIQIKKLEKAQVFPLEVNGQNGVSRSSVRHHSFEMKKTLNNSSKKYEPILDTAEPFG